MNNPADPVDVLSYLSPAVARMDRKMLDAMLDPSCPELFLHQTISAMKRKLRCKLLVDDTLVVSAGNELYLPSAASTGLYGILLGMFSEKHHPGIRAMFESATSSSALKTSTLGRDLGSFLFCVGLSETQVVLVEDICEDLRMNDEISTLIALGTLFDLLVDIKVNTLNIALLGPKSNSTSMKVYFDLVAQFKDDINSSVMEYSGNKKMTIIDFLQIILDFLADPSVVSIPAFIRLSQIRFSAIKALFPMFDDLWRQEAKACTEEMDHLSLTLHSIKRRKEEYLMSLHLQR